MGKHAQFVLGPAGSGKSTYCSIMQKHCENVKRTVHVINLDPAAEHFNYNVSVDIRELISVTDVMEELELGPNGALVYCMEYLMENIDWLAEHISDYAEDYLIFDLPGQIELFTHVPIVKNIADTLTSWGYHVAAVYLLDALFVNDASRFISGSLTCLSAMIQLELPHISVISKCDLIQIKGSKLEQFMDGDVSLVLDEIEATTSGKQKKLNEAIGSLLEDYNMVSFIPLNGKDPDSVSMVLQHVDHAVQYGDDLEPTYQYEKQMEEGRD